MISRSKNTATTISTFTKGKKENVKLYSIAESNDETVGIFIFYSVNTSFRFRKASKPRCPKVHLCKISNKMRNQKKKIRETNIIKMKISDFVRAYRVF